MEAMEIMEFSQANKKTDRDVFMISIVKNQFSISAPPRGNGAFGFDVVFAATYGLAFVGVLFAFADTEFDFDASFEKIHRKRDESVPFLLRPLAQTQDLFAVEEEFAPAQGVVVETVAEIVGRDRHVVEKRLVGALVDVRESAGESGLALAHDLDLRAEQLQTAFNPLLDEIIVRRLAVACEDFDSGAGI